ncbi:MULTISPECIES: hypothetical protein [Pseudomonas]|uniref:Uncharacterized protein n=1 Tax=Pseudomonas protegens TaxID=380021 RepID=A0A2T6GTE5_9PSED|nr:MULTISPECIES: hypothetical protein [Pseudomonas]RBJ85604.1 hypothetical protein C3L29_000695 [Pseudomonas sp. MWU12-2534b]MCO7571867.1 hypothetical protein [Pseudomonas chlororaphis]MCO7589647.1 hypothetical protein [Pseudomonas chlororaphis]MCO7611603.1 hypothetical protein [Pseudomonas chlororaphis]MDF2398612.1 hypothetical protein [Pseudomonas sp. 3MA1]
MKLSTLVFSGLILATSSAAFAEGGAEHMQRFYENFRVNQQQIHGDKNQNLAKTEQDKAGTHYSAPDAKKQQPDA